MHTLACFIALIVVCSIAAVYMAYVTPSKHVSLPEDWKHELPADGLIRTTAQYAAVEEALGSEARSIKNAIREFQQAHGLEVR